MPRAAPAKSTHVPRKKKTAMKKTAFGGKFGGPPPPPPAGGGGDANDGDNGEQQPGTMVLPAGRFRSWVKQALGATANTQGQAGAAMAACVEVELEAELGRLIEAQSPGRDLNVLLAEGQAAAPSRTASVTLTVTQPTTTRRLHIAKATFRRIIQAHAGKHRVGKRGGPLRFTRRAQTTLQVAVEGLATRVLHGARWVSRGRTVYERSMGTAARVLGIPAFTEEDDGYVR